jgi:dTMP kinase
LTDRGCFITLEGGEGVGKSTNLNFIEDFLLSHGKKVIVTREPGGTEFGESIRSLLLDVQNGPISNEAELLLLFAARAEHIKTVIRPALSSGAWVVCDRFTDATYAYQGGGRGLDESRIAYLEKWIQEGLRPDVTLLFDAPAEIGMARAKKRGKPDRFESERSDFYERIRSAYLKLASRHGERIRVIDAGQPIDAVQRDVENELKKWL